VPRVGVASPDRMRSGLAVRPGLLLGLGVVLGVAAFQLWVTPRNPPGYHRDEAALSLNAYTLETSGRDQDGAVMPLFFRSYGDYKSPLYPYLLAGVFRVTGPHARVARTVSAVLGLLAVLLLGLLAFRVTGRRVVAVVVVVLAGLTPWLFELGRVALEVATQPLLVTLLLLSVHRAWRTQSWSARQGALVGVLLGLLLYSYTGNRLLAPLFAAALAVFAGRGRWRWLLTAWASFGAFLALLGVYALRHPGTITARYEATTITRGEKSAAWVVLQAIANWFHDINPWFWTTSGDPAPYVHNGGYGSLFGAVVALAIAGAVMIVWRRRNDLWWRYVLAATLLAPIPAALTVDRHNAIRLAALPVLCVVLALPPLDALLRRSVLAGVAIVALTATIAVQFVQFVDAYRLRGPARLVLFDAGVDPLLQQAFANGRTIYIDYDDRGAQTQARWHAIEDGVPAKRIQILPDGGIPPRGSTVFGLFQPCDYVCHKYAEWEQYWLAKAAGPRSG
jgi:4-amino-4-deoxy-L-arabinose transferase-like glycosyltransferase